MISNYATKGGYKIRPEYTIKTAYVGVASARAHALERDETLILQAPEACGWKSICEVGDEDARERQFDYARHIDSTTDRTCPR